MKILITGAGGNIAGNLIRSKKLRPNEIIAVLNKGKEKTVNLPVRHIIGCDLEAGNLQNVLPEVDLIIHTASLTPGKEKTENDFISNIRIAQNVADFAKAIKVKQLIFLSTGEVYGTDGIPHSETETCRPTTGYGKSQLVCEKIFAEKIPSSKLTILRLFHTYGYDGLTNGNNFILNTLEKVINHEQVTFIKNAEEYFINPIFMRDFIRVMQRIVEEKWTGTMNIAGQKPISLKEMVDYMGDWAGYTPRIREVKGVLPTYAGTSELLKKAFPGIRLQTFDNGLSFIIHKAKRIRNAANGRNKSNAEIASLLL